MVSLVELHWKSRKRKLSSQPITVRFVAFIIKRKNRSQKMQKMFFFLNVWMCSFWTFPTVEFNKGQKFSWGTTLHEVFRWIYNLPSTSNQSCNAEASEFSYSSHTSTGSFFMGQTKIPEVTFNLTACTTFSWLR